MNGAWIVHNIELIAPPPPQRFLIFPNGQAIRNKFTLDTLAFVSHNSKYSNAPIIRDKTVYLLKELHNIFYNMMFLLILHKVYYMKYFHIS